MLYYYIAKRKPRGQSPRYVGDGIIEAKSVKEAKELVAYGYGSPVSRIMVKPHNSQTK